MLCGLAPPAAVAVGSDESRSARAPAAQQQPRHLALLQERHGLAARALSEMLCDVAHAGRCRATVRHRTASHPIAPYA